MLGGDSCIATRSDAVRLVDAELCMNCSYWRRIKRCEMTTHCCSQVPPDMTEPRTRMREIGD
jgi:hypothetical protein